MAAASTLGHTAGVTRDDERFLVVNGRRWRREDPTIPAALASELRHELMRARRAVSAALRAADPEALRRARGCVQDAKLALGERGAPWWVAWDERSAAARTARSEATMRALLRQRGPGKTICPSDVARASAGERWRAALPSVRELAAQLAERGELRVLQKGEPVDLASVRGPVRLALVK